MGIKVLSLFDGISCGRVALERAGIEVDDYYASEIDKHAIKVSKDNWNDIVHIGDVTKVAFKDGTLYTETGEYNVGKIDLVLAGSPCFSEGTLVVTSNGLIPIEKVAVGDNVLTHRGEWKRVLKTGGKLSGDRYTIKAQGILTTETTGEHPYYVRKREVVNGEKVFLKPEWKPVKDIAKGDYLGIPVIMDCENPLEITEDEAFVLGRYIADGHTRKDFRDSEGRSNDRYWQLILSIGSHKVGAFRERIPDGFSCYPHSKSVHRVVFSSKRLVELAEKFCGSGAINKEIHTTLLKLPHKLLEQVVEGILSGDGCLDQYGHRLTTISNKLIQSLQLAIAKLYGTIGNTTFTKRPEKTIIEGRSVNQHDTYTISFRKHVVKTTNFKQIEGHVWVPIREVSVVESQGIVYNLEVADDNSYIANCAVVHNCQGFSMAGKQLAFDDPRSSLYFVFERILSEIKQENPDVKFLLENVKMKKEYKDVITERLGVEPVIINSNLVSAQNRYRLYWTNISDNIEQPEDKGVLLKDVVQEQVDEKYYIKGGRLKWLNNFGEVKEKDGYIAFNPVKAKCLTDKNSNEFSLSRNCTYITYPARECGRRFKEDGTRDDNNKDSPIQRFIEVSANDKMHCVTTVQKDTLILQWPHGTNSGGYRVIDGKTPAMTTSSWESNNYLLSEGMVRKLTPEECEVLQTLPIGYTKYVADGHRYKALGNGWTVDVIAHILSYM